MNETQQLEYPTPESRFKQHIHFAQIIAEQRIQERIVRLEGLSRGREMRTTVDQAEFDKLIVEIKKLHFQIAILNLISLDVV